MTYPLIMVANQHGLILYHDSLHWINTLSPAPYVLLLVLSLKTKNFAMIPMYSAANRDFGQIRTYQLW